MLLGFTGCIFRCHLCGKRGALPASLESSRSGRGPGNTVPLHIGDRDDRVVEGRLNMGDPGLDVLADSFLAATR